MRNGFKVLILCSLAILLLSACGGGTVPPASTYTSARLKTQDLYGFTYGRVEGRIKLPYGKGIWPAFWMLGTDITTASWPGCGEIDIFELLGDNTAKVYGTIHGPGYSGANGIQGQYTLPSGGFNDDYHIFAIEWEPTQVRWYVDGHLFHTVNSTDIPGGTTWVFNHNFFIILNVAVGGGWPGNPDASTQFPQTMSVDYIRVYSRTGAGTFSTDPVWADEFSGANGSAPDASKWTYDIGNGGWGNNELEDYTNSRNNSYIQDGSLIIKAIKN